MHSSPKHARIRRHAGFTLIELLTVIAIIGILAAIIIPTVSKVRSTAKKAQCVARLRQWGTMVVNCANDHKGNVALFYQAPDSGFIYDDYVTTGKTMIVEDAKNNSNSRALKPTEAMTQCPNGLNGGNGGNRQYAFVVPIAPAGFAIRKPAGVFGFPGNPATSKDYYRLTDAVAPAQLLLMIENNMGGTQTVVSPASQSAIKTELDDKVRPLQKTEGQIRHGGIANALFLDGHVAGLRLSDTDYTNPEAKDALDRWFTLK